MSAQPVIVGTRKGLFEVRRNGGDWAVTNEWFLGARVSAVLDDPRDGARYVALDHGHFGCKLHRSDDGGRTYVEVAAPAYPPRPADATDVDPVSGAPIPWSTVLIWTVEAAHPAEPGVLWAGTIPGGLFRSPDRGATWELVRGLWDHPARPTWMGGGYDLPGIHSVAVDPRGPGRLVVGVSVGGVWTTDDGGDTWVAATAGMHANYVPPDLAEDSGSQDPHRIVRCPAQPDTIWCQHHNGVFHSTDGARSWTELTNVPPSTFGFGLAVHPRNAGTAWFAPSTSDEVRVPRDGRVVIARTTDGGKSFESCSNGLPQTSAYDLVYRHCLAVDASGDRLAVGTTTGSLWIGEDGGDRFTTVSTNLPPIASVTFGNPV